MYTYKKYNGEDLRLLVRFVMGECRPWEEADLHARLAVDTEFARLLDELEATWEAAAVYSMGEVDLESGRRRLQKRLAGSVNVRPLAPRAEVRTRRRHPAMRRRRPSSAKLLLRTAAVIIFAVGAIYISTKLDLPTVPDPAPTEVSEPKIFSTEHGQRASLRLADGTQVRLNVASKLRISPQYFSGSREVWLEGEAFFDVTPDSTRPFIVHTGGTATHVLGTRFNVRAYTDAPSQQVVVSEGSVRVLHEDSSRQDSVLLRPNDMCVLEDGRLILRRDIDTEQFLAWTAGRLVFEKAPFSEVESELERWFDLDVELRAPAADIFRLNASFTNEPLSEILNIIARSLGLDYDRDGRNVVFYRPRSFVPRP